MISPLRGRCSPGHEFFKRFMSHPICEEHLPSSLMKFCTRKYSTPSPLEIGFTFFLCDTLHRINVLPYLPTLKTVTSGFMSSWTWGNACEGVPTSWEPFLRLRDWLSHKLWYLVERMMSLKSDICELIWVVSAHIKYWTMSPVMMVMKMVLSICQAFLFQFWRKWERLCFTRNSPYVTTSPS